jgi:hypothetical protein
MGQIRSTGVDLATDSFVALRDGRRNLVNASTARVRAEPGAINAAEREAAAAAEEASAAAAEEASAAAVRASNASATGVDPPNIVTGFDGHAKVLTFVLAPRALSVESAFNTFRAYLAAAPDGVIAEITGSSEDGEGQVGGVGIKRMQVEALIKFRKPSVGGQPAVEEDDVVGSDRFLLNVDNHREGVLEPVSRAALIIANKVASMPKRETGWTAVAVLHIALRVTTYAPNNGTRPQQGGHRGAARTAVPLPGGQPYVRQPRAPARRGGRYIELPKALASKRACVNIKCDDDRCFEYAVLHGLHRDQLLRNPQRVSMYAPFRGELSFDGVAFPVRLQDIGAFERANDIGVTVFTADVRSGERKTFCEQI